MCGIAGLLSFSDPIQNKEVIQSMVSAMVHRGPNGQRTWLSPEGRIALGHARLSIIDLSEKAFQPMCDSTRRYWIVYNGEIYNFMEIREELEAEFPFATRSDTEVLLYSFIKWGEDALFKLRGMYAFAVWDEKEKELFIARDRIGIKPLYYSSDGQKFIFASEVKAILQCPWVKREVDLDSFYHYLSFLTTPPPSTMFKNVKKLPAGFWMKVDIHGNVKMGSYWDPLDNLKEVRGGEEDIAGEILTRLEESVKYRMVSDVPVGVFLSGGVDSSTNAVLFSKHTPQRVRTFSIGYRGNYSSYRNEFVYARKVAGFIGSEHHEITIDEDDLISFLPSLVFHQDEPISDPVCVPVYYVSKLARENGVIVCQVGEGSDELFFGYPGWALLLRLQKLGNLPVPAFIKRFILFLFRQAGFENSGYYELLRRNVYGQPVFWGGAESFYEGEKKMLLSKYLLSRVSVSSSFEVIEPIYRKFCEHSSLKEDPLLWMSYLDLRLRLPELLLMRVDKMSMAVSLEARVPFLDHHFVEYVLSLPSHLKFKNGELKYILKKAVKDILPKEIVYRKKQGFGVPVREWFERRLGAFARKKILEFSSRTEFFSKTGIKRLLKKPRKNQLWYLLNFILWYEMWVEGKKIEVGEVKGMCCGESDKGGIKRERAAKGKREEL